MGVEYATVEEGGEEHLTAANALLVSLAMIVRFLL